MRQRGKVILAWLLLAAPVQAAGETRDFASECERVYQVYPTLMLAAMMEGDVNCGDPDSGEYVSCYEGETAEQKAARERRVAIRQHQEAAYKGANEACRAWEADKGPGKQEALLSAIATARAADSWRPEKGQ